MLVILLDFPLNSVYVKASEIKHLHEFSASNEKPEEKRDTDVLTFKQIHKSNCRCYMYIIYLTFLTLVLVLLVNRLATLNEHRAKQLTP